jgi:hypothetical protein
MSNIMQNLKHSAPPWSVHRGFQIAVSLSVLVLLISWSTIAKNPLQQTKSATPKSHHKVADFSIREILNPRDDNQTCISQGLPEYPEEGSLLRRMPHAIVIGSMKSGTSALAIYLYQHPQVIRPNYKELHFFDFEYETYASDNGIDRKSTRIHYKQAFERVLESEGIQKLLVNSKMVALDDSPRYILLSDRVPARILCVAPWVKLLAILRNPIDRAYSHYNMNRFRAELNGAEAMPTFEEWIDMDFQLLKETNVLTEPTNEAWKNYTRKCRHAPIGRGLYALQLRQWFQAYEAAGKSRSDFFIIQSERFKEHKNQVYNQVLRFLGLEPFDLPNEMELNTGKYSEEMNTTTRARLEEFYEPYNQELYALLGKEWDGVWDP